MFFGFYKNNYSNIIIKLLSNTSYIIIIELIRNILVKKAKYYKKSLYLLPFIISFLDLSLLVSIYNVNNYSIMNIIFTMFLPIVFKNILLTYISYSSNFENSLIYRFLIDIIPLLVPISPDLSNYLYSMINILTPIIILYFLYNIYLIKSKEITKSRFIRYHKYFLIIDSIIIVFLFLIVILTTGITRIKMYTIGSNSMKKLISKGDVVIVDQKINKIKKNNIIMFKKDGKIILHRVVELIDDDLYITKGDNNKTNDEWVVRREEVIGNYIFNIKYIGWPTILIKELLE